MGEVMRFRVARAPQRIIPDPALLVNVERHPTREDNGEAPPRSAFVRKLLQLQPEAPKKNRRAGTPHASKGISPRQQAYATTFADSDAFYEPGDELTTNIQALDRWLVERGDAPATGELAKFVRDELGNALAKNWWQERQRVGDSLIASLYTDVDPGIRGALTRLMLLFGLIEAYKETPKFDSSAEGIKDFLASATVVLPAELAVSTRSSSILARRPGFADLYVVREEWNRYLLGEVAHVENVLTGESKERTHTRTTESETTTLDQRQASRAETRDSQSTDRFELSQQAQLASSLAAHAEAQVDSSGQYGVVSVDTHLGGSLDASLEHSEARATTIAKETVARAATHVVESVLHSRTERSLTKIVETNRHAIENKDGDGPVTGVYRWLDKIQRLQVFRYANRFLLEFQVPEPAAYVRWLEKNAAPAGMMTKEPAPFVLADKVTPVTPSAIKPEDYQKWVALYGVQGVEPPPTPEKTVAATLELAPTDATHADATPYDFASASKAEGGVQIPDGYMASSLKAKALGIATHNDDTLKGDAVVYLMAADEWKHLILLPTTVGNKVTETWPDKVMIWGAGNTDITFNTAHRLTNRLPLQAVAILTKAFTVNVSIKCVPTPEAMAAWQSKTYGTILSAYQALKRQYDEERASREIQKGVVINGSSPARNREVAREEIRKKTIEMLTGSVFEGRPAVKHSGSAPVTLLDAAAASSAEIQFIEQAFEWENMTYVLYPYYWADDRDWPALAAIESADPDYARFLRSGSARVIVPARPGFEKQVQLYTEYGVLWGGGSVPAPGEEGYLSVATEIRAQSASPADGVAGESWEVRLPTTLLWLEESPALPIVNASAVLDAPPGR